MRHIAVFTSSRSDWGILETLVHGLRSANRLKTTIVATGSHFDARFGETIHAITAEYADLTVGLDAGPVGDSPHEASLMASRLTRLVSQWCGESAPDAMVILGDRFEAMACGLAAALHGIPIVHLHGGEITTGAIDDSIRHALSKLARLHFPVHAEYRQRLIQMGEAPSSIVLAGSLAVEGLIRKPLRTLDELGSELEIEIRDPFVVCAVHPVTTSPGEVDVILGSLEQAFGECSKLQVVLTSPAPDPGFADIERRFEGWCAKEPDKFIHRASLGSGNFLSLVSHSSGLVGNSSSGVLEIPSLGVPTLNIGTRQRGRVRASSVLDSQPTVSEVRAGLSRMLSTNFRRLARQTINPIAGEHPSRAIITALEGTDFAALGAKEFHDLEITS